MVTVTHVNVYSIHPHQLYVVPVDEFRNWISEYGSIVHPETNAPCRVESVRVAEFSNVEPFASCRWLADKNHKWTQYHLNTAAGSPMLTIDR